MLMVLALAPPAALPQAPSPGPTPPAVKGLVKTIPLGAGVAEYVRWSLNEMGQAVVVVEGEYAMPLPKVATGIRIFDGNLALFRARLPLPTDMPVAPWMDMNTVGAPGNPAGKSYPMGWGY